MWKNILVQICSLSVKRLEFIFIIEIIHGLSDIVESMLGSETGAEVVKITGEKIEMFQIRDKSFKIYGLDSRGIRTNMHSKKIDSDNG